MKTYFVKTMGLMAVLALCVATLPGLGLAAGGTPAIKQKVELLFVQNSRGVAIDKDKGTLTLKGVSPTTLWFSDRPVRMAGHFNMKEYLATWEEGKDSFSADPPNATLSVFEQGQDELLDVVVKLQNPRLQGDDLTYDITLIDKEGLLPKKGGPASLFIDIFGVWRRAARRTVWIGAAATTAAVATTEASAAAAAAAKPTTVVVKETPPPAPATAAPAATNTQAALLSKLKELKSLQKQGLITEAQYQAESQKILNQLVE
ncbi:MAG: hypothetical protein H6Q48_4751 [Deltaproteobacteria bacterium]|nr:hypothetical protein [Deltaproteobacteria bacterium]